MNKNRVDQEAYADCSTLFLCNNVIKSSKTLVILRIEKNFIIHYNICSAKGTKFNIKEFKMLTLKTNKMELRGVQSQTSKKGNSYYIIYCEDVESSKPFQFFCKEFNALPSGLKKGDIVQLTVQYNSFKELTVTKVEKVG